MRISLSCEFRERKCVGLSCGEQGGDSESGFVSQLVAMALGDLLDEAMGSEEPYAACDGG